MLERTDAALPETVDENCMETANNVCDLTVDVLMKMNICKNSRVECFILIVY